MKPEFTTRENGKISDEALTKPLKRAALPEKSLNRTALMLRFHISPLIPKPFARDSGLYWYMKVIDELKGEPVLMKRKTLSARKAEY